MDGSPVDASDIEVEVARDTEPPSDYYSLDTTLFFETVELHDERPHLLKTVNGETIRINPSEEVDVDAFLAQQLHTSRNGDKSVHSEFEDSEVEVPRGAGLEQTKLHSGVESEVFPSCASEQSSKDGSRKLEEFMRNLKRDPEWARSIPFVKLNAMVPKDVQMELVAHAYLNVNARPKQLVVLTKCMDTADLTEHIKRAFEPTEVPMQKSLFRLYCRNATPNLRSLIRSILTATAATPGLEVEYTDVLGEVCYKGSKVRMKTSDIKRFCTLEDAGRSMGMRYLTTFNCRSTRNPHRVMDIRYYDEMKPDYSRVTYIHLDHEAFNHRPLRFSDVNVEIPFDVDTDHMTPLHQMYPHVYDLNEMIRKLHAQHSQQHSL